MILSSFFYLAMTCGYPAHAKLQNLSAREKNACINGGISGYCGI